MTQGPIDLKLFFCADATKPVFDCCDPGQTTQALKAAVQGLPRPCWAALQGAAGRLVDQLFEVRLEDLLASGWKTFEDVADRIRRSREEPRKIFPLDLVDHTLSSRQEPWIEVTLGAKSVTQIRFLIELDLELKGVELEFRNGRIEALDAGSCQGSARFGLGQTELIRRATPEFQLPGRLSFVARTTPA